MRSVLLIVVVLARVAGVSEEATSKLDVILADYLIGAIDGFSPFTQELTFQRLRRHLAPGGRLYVIGLQPLPDHAPAPADVVCEVRRLRDACTSGGWWTADERRQSGHHLATSAGPRSHLLSVTVCAHGVAAVDAPVAFAPRRTETISACR